MEHVLDNPVWHALIGPQATLAAGSGLARHYPRDIVPFSAIAEPSAAACADLARDLPHGLEARLFRPNEEATLPGWETISVRPIIQMIANNIAMFSADTPVPLGAADVSDMLELTELAKPGPFAPRMHILGRYIGYRNQGCLLTMGDERLRVSGFVELSAICTRPNTRGRGLGASITTQLARSVLAQGATPFLHVFPDNPAMGLYRRLGFYPRKQLYVVWRRPVQS